MEREAKESYHICVRVNACVRACVYGCTYVYISVHEFPHANIDYDRQRRKTNQLRESASIIAGVAAVRNASRKPDVDGR